MSDDVDNLFDEKEQPEVAEKPEKEAPDPVAEQPEGEPEPEQAEEAKGEDKGEPPSPTEDESERNVPYGALKDERTKRQALERELADIRKWRQDIETRAREARLAQIEDPDERVQAYQQQWQQTAVAQKLDMSRRYAERVYGSDTVNEVVEFFNDPQHAPMSHQFLQTDDPFGSAVEYYNAQKALSEIGPDPKAYEARLREQIKSELMAEISPAKPKAPPRSMAAAPSAGGNSNPPGSGFDAMFGAKD